MKILLVSVLLLFADPTLSASWETTSFRTNRGGLVRVGMPAAEARRELGAESRHQRSKSKGKGNEVWIYPGSDGTYKVTLSGGQVSRIVVTPKRD